MSTTSLPFASTDEYDEDFWAEKDNSDARIRATIEALKQVTVERDLAWAVLREVVTLVEEVEAFPMLVAQHMGLSDDGLLTLERAHAVLAKSFAPSGA